MGRQSRSIPLLPSGLKRTSSLVTLRFSEYGRYEAWLRRCLQTERTQSPLGRSPNRLPRKASISAKVVLPKNSIRRLYQPHGHMSNGMTTETMVTKNHRIPRASGCFTTGRRPVAANKPGKLMSTITPHASIGDAIRRPAESRRLRPATAVPPPAVSVSCDPAINAVWNCDSSRSNP